MGSVVRNSRLRLNQGQIFWRETGQGEAIAFIHREYGDGSQWLDFFESFGKDYHCFAPDLMGFGDSDPAASPQSIQWQSEILAAFCNHLNLKKIYLIGDSLGAWVAARHTLDYPDQIQGLILLAPIGFETQSKADYLFAKLLLLPVPILPWLLKILFPLGKLIGLGQQIQKILNYRQQLLASPASRRLLFQRHASKIQAEYVGHDLSQITAPTLILSDNPKTDQARLYAQRVRQAQVITIEHQSEAIVLIRDWLQQQRS
ncbi:alpha/beta fold hydrolase [Picosynechococcus sp. NKBG15041c]|uniref:alpha/beta fold hydrolase n=1 Tax=Picosynechococcus sp. NKBG15041c TaxID=1407650 RepID=UPI000404A14C|nr:alpha/beta fold hydrolase [Picosynechococcus sp. NKBG15041c]